MRTTTCILDGHRVVPADFMTWAMWLQHADETQVRVGLDTVGNIKVSTMFIGLNFSHYPDDPPIVFETICFGGPCWHQRRYSSWEAAEAGHAVILAEHKETG